MLYLTALDTVDDCSTGKVKWARQNKKWCSFELVSSTWFVQSGEATNGDYYKYIRAAENMRVKDKNNFCF